MGSRSCSNKVLVKVLTELIAVREKTHFEPIFLIVVAWVILPCAGVGCSRGPEPHEGISQRSHNSSHDSAANTSMVFPGEVILTPVPLEDVDVDENDSNKTSCECITASPCTYKYPSGRSDMSLLDAEKVSNKIIIARLENGEHANDCGVVSLCVAFELNNLPWNYAALLEELGDRQSGLTMLQLRNCASAHHAEAIGKRLSPDNLRAELRRGAVAIAHSNANHFFAIASGPDCMVTVIDPTLDDKVVEASSLVSQWHWYGTALLITSRTKCRLNDPH